MHVCVLLCFCVFVFMKVDFEIEGVEEADEVAAASGQ